jgi:hypothetical protein
LSAATPKKQTTGDQSLENKPTVVVCVHSSWDLKVFWLQGSMWSL